MREAGSFDFTLQALRNLDVAISEEIERLGGNKILSTLMKKLGSDIFSPKPPPAAASSSSEEP